MKPLRLTLAVLAFSLAGAATAQAPTVGVFDDAPVVDALIVRAYGGPPWWRVSDKDTTVYILGGPLRLPKGVTFDRTLLDKRLTGANVVILPPASQTITRSRKAVRAEMTRMSVSLNENTALTLEPSLPSDVRARFVAAREKLGYPAQRYGGLTVGMAAAALLGDANHKTLSGNVGGNPTDQSLPALVAAAAKLRRTPVKSAGNDVMSREVMYRDYWRPGLPCLASVLDLVEGKGPRHLPPEQQMRAWAEGDVRPLLDQQRRNEGMFSGVAFGTYFNVANGSVHLQTATRPCVAAMPALQQARSNGIQLQVDAILTALKRPGHAVAVVDFGSLLYADGVLDRLRRQGYAITLPDAD